MLWEIWIFLRSLFSHDAAEPVAYRLQNNGKAVAVATDMGCYSDYTVSYLKGLDGILLEADHDM